RGQPRARLDRGHRAAERRQRAGRLTRTAAHLEHRRPFVDARDGDEVDEQLVRITGPDPVVELGYLVEHPTELGSVRSRHHTIMPDQSQVQRTAATVSRMGASPPMTRPSSLTIVAIEPFGSAPGGRGRVTTRSPSTATGCPSRVTPTTHPYRLMPLTSWM